MEYRDSVSRRVKKKPNLKSTGPTRYSGLVGRSGRPEPVSDVYQGVWHGTAISFDRNFRGHRFTDEECKALCNGERIEIHNIVNRHGVYAVQGHLEENTIAFLGGVKFVVLDTVPNNPDFHYGMPLHSIDVLQEKYKLNTDVVDLDDNSDLDGILFEDPRDILERENNMVVKASKAALSDKGDDNRESENSEAIKVIEVVVEPEPVKEEDESNDVFDDGNSYEVNPADYMISDADYDDDIPNNADDNNNSDSSDVSDEEPEESTEAYIAAMAAYVQQTGKIIPDEVIDARIPVEDIDVVVPDVMNDEK